MKRLLALPATLIGALFMANAAAADPVVEIVLYSVKDPAAFAEMQKGVHDQIRLADGYVEGRTIRSATTPDLYGSIITWASLEQAQTVADAAMKDPAVKPFLDSLAEIKVFEQFQTLETFKP